MKRAKCSDMCYLRAFTSTALCLSPLALSTRALELADRFGLSATYDAHYLALAEREGCEYWTADERLWNSVRAQLGWVRWLGEYSAAGSPTAVP
jgi:predicted nucleic acid-binding protein